MMQVVRDAWGRLSPSQRQRVSDWVPDARVEADHSWGLVETTVLELVSEQGRLIVKAGGDADRHIAREIRAHRRWVGVWAREGYAPALRHADIDAKLLVTDYLPGVLVEGRPARRTADTFHQAGVLLAQFHGQADEWDPTWNEECRARVERQLSLPHRIAPETERRIRTSLATPAWRRPSWRVTDRTRARPTRGVGRR